MTPTATTALYKEIEKTAFAHMTPALALLGAAIGTKVSLASTPPVAVPLGVMLRIALRGAIVGGSIGGSIGSLIDAVSKRRRKG